jgi:predicted Zn-ribbon and HTH transcriptional regulator
LSPTRRQEILTVLEGGELSFDDLRRLLELPVAVLEEDLRHLEHSLRGAGRRLLVTPARCPGCGFGLRRRAGRFATPSRCPRCGQERLEPPRLAVSG